MDLSPRAKGRMVVALAIIAVAAVSAWFTLEAGKPKTLTFVLLAFFAFRILLLGRRSR